MGRFIIFLAIIAQHLFWRYFGHSHKEYAWSSLMFLMIVAGIVVFLWPVNVNSDVNKK